MVNSDPASQHDKDYSADYSCQRVTQIPHCLSQNSYQRTVGVIL